MCKYEAHQITKTCLGQRDIKEFISTCQPMPRLRIEGGIGVALLYLDAAINVPVDCKKQRKLYPNSK